VNIGLEALTRRVQDEMSLFEHPSKPWITPRHGPAGEPVRDVVIVGAGQSGLGIAAALQRERIENFEVLDEAQAGQEGPWITTARMLTLRTLKFLTGPDLGLPSLTYRAWHEAQWGRRSYEEMARIPKEEWMRYLVWLRHTLRIPVRNAARLLRVEPGGPLTLHLQTPAGPERLLARKLVIATGIEGAGRRRVPDFVRAALPPERWAHTADAIDFERLRGRRVVVVGAGASAFDNAATALEAGAATVDILIRRPELPSLNAFRVLETRGFFRNFGDAPDAHRWRFMQRMLSLPMPPPDDTVARVRRHANARIRLGAPLLDVADAVDAIRVRTPSGWDEADFLILGTGYGVDLATRPELADLAPYAATWADRYAPPAAEADPAVARYPYLGPGFELTEREPGTLPALANIHLFTIGAVVSLGPIAGGLNGMPWGVSRLIAALSRDLFMPELDAAFAAFRDYDEADPWESVKAAGD